MQLEALVHPFFDELRDPNTRLPNGRFLPPLFNFKSHGKNEPSLLCFYFSRPILNYCIYTSQLMILGLHYHQSELKNVPVEMLVKLVPDHAKKQCGFHGL